MRGAQPKLLRQVRNNAERRSKRVFVQNLLEVTKPLQVEIKGAGERAEMPFRELAPPNAAAPKLLQEKTDKMLGLIHARPRRSFEFCELGADCDKLSFRKLARHCGEAGGVCHRIIASILTVRAVIMPLIPEPDPAIREAAKASAAEFARGPDSQWTRERLLEQPADSLRGLCRARSIAQVGFASELAARLLHWRDVRDWRAKTEGPGGPQQ